MKTARVFALGAIAALALANTVQAYNDTDILNFALNLECLEAEFYSWAAFGEGLNETQRGGGPASVGGMLTDLGSYQGIAEEIAMEEIAHVDFLRAALGPLAVPCPPIDIGTAFAAAADAALGDTLVPPFSPYKDYIQFLHGALLFEDVGVMAYNGAIGLIVDKDLAKAARSIMAVEAYHAGIIRENLSLVFNTTVEPYGAPVSAIVAAISTTLDTLLGLERMQPIGDPNGGNPNLIPADENALAYAITPSQVLNVVYLSPEASMGGFFPEGISGPLNETRGELDEASEDEAPAPPSMANYTDADILNFALNLECLEAEFYSWAAFGEGLSEEARGGGPESVGGMKANLTLYQGIAEEIADEEIKHVMFLRTALGDAAEPCPAMDIGPAFSAAADAALATTLDPAFSPYEDDVKFLHGALLFEDVGVMAYNGAIEALTVAENKAASRGIMAVEAYHAGIIRFALSSYYNTTVEPYSVPVSAIVEAISTTLDALTGLERMQPIGPTTAEPNLVPTDGNALAYSIGTRQTLNVVYLAPGAMMGGFFPEGITGVFGQNDTTVIDEVDAVTNPDPTAPTTSLPSTRSVPPATGAASPATASLFAIAAASVLALML